MPVTLPRPQRGTAAGDENELRPTTQVLSMQLTEMASIVRSTCILQFVLLAP